MFYNFSVSNLFKNFVEVCLLGATRRLFLVFGKGTFFISQLYIFVYSLICTLLLARFYPKSCLFSDSDSNIRFMYFVPRVKRHFQRKCQEPSPSHCICFFLFTFSLCFSFQNCVDYCPQVPVQSMSLPPPSSSLLDGPHITAGPGSIQSASQHHVAAPGSLYQHLLKQPLSHVWHQVKHVLLLALPSFHEPFVVTVLTLHAFPWLLFTFTLWLQNKNLVEIKMS